MLIEDKDSAFEHLLNLAGDNNSIEIERVKEFTRQYSGIINYNEALAFLKASSVNVITPRRRVSKSSDPLKLYLNDIKAAKILDRTEEHKIAVDMFEAIAKIKDLIPLSTLTLEMLISFSKGFVDQNVRLGGEFGEEFMLDHMDESVKGIVVEQRKQVHMILDKIREDFKKIMEISSPNQTSFEETEALELKYKYRENIEIELDKLEFFLPCLVRFVTPIKEILFTYYTVISQSSSIPILIDSPNEDTVINLLDEMDEGDTDKETFKAFHKTVKNLLADSKNRVQDLEKAKRQLEILSLVPLNVLINEYKKIDEYWDDFIRGRKQLVESNIKLVVRIAKNFVGMGVEFLDLIQEGNKGLVEAVERFDPQRGFRFGSYAVWWIRQAIRELISGKSRTIRIPKHQANLINKVVAEKKRLTQELGRVPSLEKIAQSMELSKKQLKELRGAMLTKTSLDRNLGGSEGFSLIDVIEDEGAEETLRSVNKYLLQKEINKALEKLPPQEKQIIILRYGLLDGKARTLAEIGKIMGVSRERIRQIESNALQRLRSPLLR
ncbi:sigma-70 family RNA polymerase sigma factor [bacterium]|nr:sigma-70 family RNA polymerase sigma factor [bacterium]